MIITMIIGSFFWLFVGFVLGAWFAKHEEAKLRSEIKNERDKVREVLAHASQNIQDGKNKVFRETEKLASKLKEEL